VKLTAVQRFKVLGAALPGQQLKVTAKLDTVMGNLAQITGSVSLPDGTPLATGTIMLASATA
jgi:3-hydroxymyristoyl/3-hydroxydecanoyl-(acyl carrier protein) dehydratase